MIDALRRSRSFERARDDDLAAVLARAGPDVDDVVGDADRLLVVLDDDHGVAEVAQPHQRLDEALVVALVQADRRLVEHVEHADEPAADLRREPDALRLAAGERGRRAVERQVVEADVEQELQPLVDLLEHRARRSCRSRSESSTVLEELARPCGSTARRPRRCSCRRSSPRATPGCRRAPSHAGHGTWRM